MGCNRRVGDSVSMLADLNVGVKGGGKEDGPFDEPAEIYEMKAAVSEWGPFGWTSVQPAELYTTAGRQLLCPETPVCLPNSSAQRGAVSPHFDITDVCDTPLRSIARW